MNETRDLIIGIDFGKEYSQICYYDRKAEEPRSLPVKVGSSQFEMPTCLCLRPDRKTYCAGLEAEYFAREKGGFLAGNLYEISAQNGPVAVGGEKKEAWELLAHYLHEMLKLTGIAEVEKNIRSLSIAMDSLNAVQVENLQRACRELGIPEERTILLDYEESFYYYVMTQKIETWNRSVGWYSFEQQKVSFRRMSMNSGTRPVLVHLEEPVTTTLSAKVEERDAEFYTFIKNTLGKELYSSIQINGEGFDQEWAQKSVKLLCYQRRTKELVFIVDTMGEAKEKRIAMALPGLPERPERTTRLGVNLQYTSQDECRVTVKDLGFGEMFPSSGKEWTETTRWQEETK